MEHSTDLTRRYQEGVSHHQRGALSDALAAYRDVLRADPRHHDALVMAGRALVDAGQAGQALGPLGEALQVNPESVDAYNAVAMAQQALGHAGQAEEALTQALSRAPRHPESLNMMGVVKDQAGRADEAEAYFRQAVGAAPDYHGAHLNLGTLLARGNRIDDAIVSLTHAIRTNPNNPQAYAIMYNVLMRRGALNAALPVLEGWVGLEPNNPRIKAELGGLLTQLGEHEKATACLDAALALNPDLPEARIKKAELLDQQGDRDGAWELIRPMIESGEKNAEAALLFGALSGHLDRREEAAELLTRAIAERWNPALEGGLQHRAAELYDRLGRVDDAFRHARLGNAAFAAAGLPFDVDAHEAWVNRLIATYGGESVADLAQAETGRDLPVFIVGMPRSGTSLVEQIIASHPQAHGAGELVYIKDIAGELERNCNAPYPELAPMLTPEELNWGADQYLERLRAHAPKATRIVDKMPNNLHYVGLIAQLFPGARIIHTRRDPVDTCLSCYFQAFPGLSYTRDLAHLGRYHNAAERLMAHWKQVLPVTIHTVQYEQLISDQERVSRELIDYCGLLWDDACLQFHKTRRTVATASYDQVRQPLYSKAVGRWKPYEAHLQPLLAVLAVLERD